MAQKHWTGTDVGRATIQHLIDEYTRLHDPHHPIAVDAQTLEEIKQTLDADDRLDYNRYVVLYDGILEAYAMAQMMEQQFYHGYYRLLGAVQSAKVAIEANLALDACQGEHALQKTASQSESKEHQFFQGVMDYAGFSGVEKPKGSRALIAAREKLKGEPFLDGCLFAKIIPMSPLPDHLVKWDLLFGRFQEETLLYFACDGEGSLAARYQAFCATFPAFSEAMIDFLCRKKRVRALFQSEDPFDQVRAVLAPLMSGVTRGTGAYITSLIEPALTSLYACELVFGRIGELHEFDMAVFRPPIAALEEKIALLNALILALFERCKGHEEAEAATRQLFLIDVRACQPDCAAIEEVNHQLFDLATIQKGTISQLISLTARASERGMADA